MVVEDDLGVQIILPLEDGVKGGGPGEVKHNDRGDGVLVINMGHAPKPLVPGDVPTINK